MVLIIDNQVFVSVILIIRGEPGGTRTPNLLVRSQMLYPIKLQVRFGLRKALIIVEDANITKFLFWGILLIFNY